MGEARIWYQVCVYVAFVAVAVVAADRVVETFCPGPIRYYEDLGCTPIFRNEQARCPSRYNCDHIKKRDNRNICYINGHAYHNLNPLRREDANPCEDSCYCIRGPSKDKIAAFECDMTNRCPEVRVGRGCYLRKNPSTCCGDPKEICIENVKDRPFCTVNNNVYLDGDEFYPEEEPAMVCRCRPGYKGKNVPPFCIKFNHVTERDSHPAFSHVDHFGKRCAPFLKPKFTQFDRKHYYSGEMACQSPDDKVIPRKYNLESDKNFDWNNVCLLGNLVMRIGDGMENRVRHDDACQALCICEVPPVPTCNLSTLNRNCTAIRLFFDQP